MGRSSQLKGKHGEQELAELLRQYGYQVERSPSKNFGTAPDIVGLPGVHIECKRVERLNVWEAMEQSIHDAERFHDGVPIVFHRKNRRPWLITMRLEDFMKLYKTVSKTHTAPDGAENTALTGIKTVHVNIKKQGE